MTYSSVYIKLNNIFQKNKLSTIPVLINLYNLTNIFQIFNTKSPK
jgi:hypothetical protein